ncbi:MAG: OmpH family outer membrane protein [Candidatus Gastranaerophilales bacterium]|nr:OmpH family outer membrane protein [Candidatus Gastranaerophilales bacterium]
MKTSKFLLVSAMAIALSLNNFAMAKETAKAQEAPKAQKVQKIQKVPAGFNVAVVDIVRIVESSPEINSLRTERKNKLNELVAFVEKARADVEKETNSAKKKALEDKYNKELNERKDAIDKDYSKKLLNIDKNITTVIKSKSKKANYDLVLTKNSVIDGGTDITSEIIKELK